MHDEEKTVRPSLSKLGALPALPALHTSAASAAMNDFKSFLTTDLGKALLVSEAGVIDSHLPSLVACNLLQLSVQKAKRLSQAANVGQYIQLGFAPSVSGTSRDSLWADYQSFPIATDCIDIALLHHVLEFSADPHQVLREADRTLTAGGHMLVVGFNPISVWPVYQGYAHWVKGLATMGHTAIRQNRLTDWLSVLNYDVIHQQSYFYRPPINRQSVLERLQGLERFGESCRLPLGLFYLVIAKKRSFPVNFIRQHWMGRMKTPRTSGIHHRQ